MAAELTEADRHYNNGVLYFNKNQKEKALESWDQALKADPETASIPIVIVTALDSREDRLTGIGKGADDFLSKPFDTQELALRLRNLLKIKQYSDFLKSHATLLEEMVGERTRKLREAFEELARTQDKVNRGYIETIYRLGLLAEFKDEDTGAHIRRIAELARELAAAAPASPRTTSPRRRCASGP